MKISELIGKLIELQVKHGDKTVMVFEDGYTWFPVRKVEYYPETFNCPPINDTIVIE